MKKRLVFLLCLAAFAALFTVSALAATEGDYEYTVTDGAATIIKYTGPGGDVAIPSELGGYPVVSITGYNQYGFQGAFEDCNGLKSVTIGNSVTTIGGCAFRGCTCLTSMTIGNSVTTFADGVFEGCSGLTSVIIGNKVTRIGYDTFSGCTRLTSVTIPNSVTYIVYGVFSGCSSDLVLSVGADSYAHQYAKDNSIPYIIFQSGWQKISNKWYYFNSSGAMVTDWQTISGKTYYFQSGGAMATGWKKLDGKWYYFESSGVMLANTDKTINCKTYHFDQNGVCTNP